MKLVMALLMAFSFSSTAMSCTEDGVGGILPENNLNIPHYLKSLGGISEAEFNNVIDKVETLYSPVITRMGGKLKINRGWTDGTVNANATRSGSTWLVNMYGGLARHSTITSDGFALVLCHELGHQIGGAPKINNIFGLNSWASNEGQSDYFASVKCLREVFLNDDNAKVVSTLNAPKVVSDRCVAAHGDKRDQDICIRSSMAGDSVAKLFAALRNSTPAKFDTPDIKVVAKTDDKHPAFQCRLDTFFQGALCDKDFRQEVSQKNEVTGTCHKANGDTSGLRPLCWFKPSK